MRKTNGILILVLGILSVTGGGALLGIPAWILGNQSLQLIRSGQATDEELGMVQAGRILGIITTMLTVLGFCVFGAVFLGLQGTSALRR